jgi:hypothetical protein
MVNTMYIFSICDSVQFLNIVSILIHSSLQKKGIHSLVFLCSSGLIFITKNTFLDLKTDVHNLCTSARPRNIR